MRRNQKSKLLVGSGEKHAARAANFEPHDVPVVGALGPESNALHRRLVVSFRYIIIVVVVTDDEKSQ